jgi:predicted ATPase/class 3 adenylate cyclase/DNA-binding SARP family transcriptional activator
MPGEAVSEDALAEAVWGDAPPPTAVKTLRAYVSRLRKVLVDASDGARGDLTIETTPGGYVLRIGADGRDVDEVAALLDSARTAAAAGDVAWATLAFARALSAWRGRPLGEFADEPFARAESVRLEELRQLVVEERIDAQLASGHHSELLGELEALTGAYPLRERLWAQRMTALYRAGRQADALQVYQELRRTLDDELGIDPSPALVDLHAAILKQSPTLDWISPRATSPPDGSAVDLPSGVVTFLLTDIEGSTALWDTKGDAMRAALARHDEVIVQSVLEHRGRLVKPKGEGDSAFAVFASATDAVGAAVAAQRTLSAQTWPGDVSIRVRMAVHTGEAELRAGDYFGAAVNRAARLREVASGGQIVLSAAAAELVGDGLRDGLQLIDLGEHRLRDLSRPEHVFQLTHPALPRGFPPLRSDSGPSASLPAQRTLFVGRDRELRDVAAALDASPLVTLTGVGGVGKTRLALEVAATVLGGYRDGAWLVELAPAVDPAALVEVVATALGVTQNQGQTLDASVLAFLRTKRLLLVLDNCEHLLDAAAHFVDDVLRVCRDVRVLATSREGLGVAGERIVAVPTLEVPAEGDDGDLHLVENAESVRLFVARAAEAKAGFTLTEKNRTSIVQLCRRLDGIPLAIELAAARVRSLGPADLATRIDERFRLLAGGPRTAVERHQTLRRAIDWSYDLLDEIERRALNRLAVFAGSFDLEAAEAVLSGDGIDAGDVLDLVSRLVVKSLVVLEDQDDNTRYRLLETIRSYGLERLETCRELETLRRRHAEHYAAFAARAGDGLRGPEEVSWTARTDAELDNLRAVVAWSVGTGDVDLALRLVAPFAMAGTRIGYASVPWAESVVGLEGAPDHPLFPEVLAWAAYAAATAGDFERAFRRADEALARAQVMSLPSSSALRVLVQSSIVAMWCGRHEELARVTARWLELARSSDEGYYLAGALTMSGTVLLLQGGDVERARGMLDEGLVVARRVGNPSALAIAASMAGESLIRTEPDRAKELLDEGLRAATSVDNRLTMGAAVVFSVYLLLAGGDGPEAAQRVVNAGLHTYHAGDTAALRGMFLPAAITVLAKWGADETAARLIGAVKTETVSDQVKEQFEEMVAALRQRIGDDRLAAYAAQGAVMDDDALVALVQANISSYLSGG